ncbi:hypothetical protein SERLA73DRAFT_72860 [Serpula lacrymans var. lacrymans S7.3]|uniref:Uncharacterized protein n=2 Tax=Serpula lacrymans var. lacrymans TaxID=341189 RepID=F8PVB4_SERL3|nr:uncharacterized protein SERLADRAFT_437407 [Serpula lacrymans var. lacrymans S7.9]EGO00124.1 hypothetical protein SERLA73DRAFT_72860 [Serpula lacrymans var. lacrymans S7.3]EGO25688.1 hypothetical protein SERLADRAFT_437407 [Serpula lacrymans var. lacrymans S7.9]
MKLGLAATAQFEDKNAREGIEQDRPILPPSHQYWASSKDSPQADTKDSIGTIRETPAPFPFQWRLFRLSCHKSSLKIVTDSKDERTSVGRNGSDNEEGENNLEPIDLMDIFSEPDKGQAEAVEGVEDDSLERVLKTMSCTKIDW